MNLYILMPWGMVEVKDVGQASFSAGAFANVRRANSAEFVAHVDTAKFPIVFSEQPPVITGTAAPHEPQPG